MSDLSQTGPLHQKIAELEKKLKDYLVLIDNTPDLLYRTDIEGKITFVSGSVEKLSGYTVEQAIGMKMADEVYLYPEERNRFLALLQENGKVKNFEARLRRRDNSVWWASTNAHFHRDEEGKIIGVEGVTRDVSDLKKAEEAQRQSEELFRLAFQTSPDAVYLNRASNGMFIDINAGFTKIMGYTREDTIGTPSLALDIWRYPNDREKLIAELQSCGFVENLEADFIGKDGKSRTVLVSARLLNIHEEDIILSITRDMTERKKLELQLQQAQKFEALGTLAGGIAHDFNNILMGIQGRASLLSISLSGNDTLLEHVQSIEEYVRNATHLTRQILGFARAGKYETKPIDVNEFIKKNSSMYGRTNKEITIHLKTHKGELVVEADTQQLGQVLLNIFVNAKQAMPKGGDLYIESCMTNLSNPFCSLHNILPGQFCRITITDTGMGMDQETRGRAFDPFFTTKEKERGTGLGLASARGIIKNHGGVITLSSEVGFGTSVDIYLPLSGKKPLHRDEPAATIAKGTGHILLIDDEPLVTEVGKAMLEALGYNVQISQGGLEAIELLSGNGNNIDLIILDLIMPEMDGEKTFYALQKINPQIPVLLSSGYSINGQVLEILKNGCSGFIQKPFNLQELSAKVKKILRPA